jgi:hypothetical protein
LAIPETFWSESLEVLIKIEGGPDFKEGEKGSPQDIHKQWVLIYKNILKVPWKDISS